MHNSIYFCISSNLDFRDDLLANQMIRNRIQLCRGASVDLAKETGKTFLIKWKDDSQDRISAKDNLPSHPAQAEFGQKLAPHPPHGQPYCKKRFHDHEKGRVQILFANSFRQGGTPHTVLMEFRVTPSLHLYGNG